jgi:hypothetical protein
LDAANAFCVARFLCSAGGEKGLRFEKMLGDQGDSREPTEQPSAVRPAARPPHSLPRRRRAAFVNRHEAKTASLRRASCAPIFYQHNAHKKVLAEQATSQIQKSVCYVAALSGEKFYTWVSKIDLRVKISRDTGCRKN